MGGAAHPAAGRLMRAALGRLWGRLDWRGLSLLISGISWVAYGASIAVQPRYGTVRGISVLLDLMPMGAWGWGWIVCGVVALVCAPLRAGRDLAGVAAAMAPPLLWALAYTMGWLSGASGTAWGAVAPWGSHAVLIAIIAYLTRTKMIVPVVTYGPR
ncbi:hypothetical protein [Streptomyces sp. IB2014 016-6]|uniref:hypothetical protein n=1 Tax=Streptomyces sp. IB2014 016-6 TaxID=2517818 RepID=UPI0011C72EA6|nr:hypothetical protein [Streptomyces sp. IB2014 016-6]TXL91571.1 hypothetical protein EW053_04390 [Streptomyces sp. IB2014 016-6]